MFGDPEAAWTAGFSDMAAPAWKGAFGFARLAGFGGRADLYFSQGRLAPADPEAPERARRGNATVAEHVMIAIDDVGTAPGSKVSPAKLDALLAAGLPPPMARVETSPGNEQWFWRLAVPIPSTDADGCMGITHLRALLAAHGLTDRKAIDPSHFFRLGLGWNSKPGHVAANGGTAPQVQYLEIDVTRVATLDELGSGFFGPGWRNMSVPGGLARTAASGGDGGARTARLADGGLYFVMAAEIGMNPVQTRPGVVAAHCPNIDQHTPDGNEATGFAFLSDTEMHCHHGHCAELTSSDFRRMIRDQFKAEMADRSARGLTVVAADAGALNGRLAAAAFAASPIDQCQLVLLAGGVAASAPAGGEGTGKRPKQPVHVQARELLAREGIEPFLDDLGGVWLTLDGWLRGLRSQSGLRALTGWLAERGLDVIGQSRGNLVEALEGLAAKKPQKTVYFRAANDGPPEVPLIYFNLMDAEGRAVHIDGAGWQVVAVKDLPLPLAHRDGGLPMPVPVRATDGVSFMVRLERHVPLAPVLGADDPRDEGVRQRAVLLTFLVGQFVRTGAVPHLALLGEQGGGKTTTARRLNALTDPDAAAVLSRLPSDEASIFAMAGQVSNLVLDNASAVRAEQADVLCVLSTGATTSARTLYTNHARSLARALCSVIFTSVVDTGLTRRPDLLDRMLPLHTQPLPAEQRKGEAELNAAWEADLPFLLAGLFDLLSVGLNHVNAVRVGQRLKLLPPPPRFVDVAQVAEGAAWQGLDWPAGVLTQALNGLRQDAARDQLNDDPIAYRLRELLRTTPGGTWAASFEEIERALRQITGPTWPPGLSVKAGLPRVTGPMRTHWGVETTEYRRKDARGREFRLLGANKGGA